MKRIATKMMYRQVSAAFDLWCQAVEFSKAGAIGEELLALRRQIAEMEQARMRNAIKKLMRGKLTDAFNIWYTLWEESRETKLKIKRSLAKMMNKALVGSFDRWLEMVEEAKEMRVLLSRCAKKMSNRALSASFDVDLVCPAWGDRRTTGRADGAGRARDRDRKTM